MTDKNTLPISFTQYMRPNGRPEKVVIHRPNEIADKALRIVEAGFSLECEVLMTGDVSLTITDSEYGNLAIEVVRNGPGVPPAVDRMILNFDIEAAKARLKEG